MYFTYYLIIEKKSSLNGKVEAPTKKSRFNRDFLEMSR